MPPPFLMQAVTDFPENTTAGLKPAAINFRGAEGYQSFQLMRLMKMLSFGVGVKLTCLAAP